MNLVMSYIDHNSTNLSQREVLSLSKTKIQSLYNQISSIDGILGCVIISTCNRTEIYFSLEDHIQYNPFLVLCDLINIKNKDYNFNFTTLYNYDAIRHLCNLCSGILSQIWGEDQIITQVKDSILLARECNASDSILEVVFRTGISCGKKVKTLIAFPTENPSAAMGAVNLLKKYSHIKDILVIGNGAMGKLVSQKLIEEGYKTFVTLRKYKYHDTVVPKGSIAVEYDLRYSFMEQVQCVISATVSPHYTVKAEEFSLVKNKPELLIDLAVPRDIDSLIKKIPNVKCFNIDEISCDVNLSCKQKINQDVNIITEKYINDFTKWYQFRERTLLKI